MAELPKDQRESSVCSVFIYQAFMAEKREVVMVGTKDVGFRNYCDSMYKELSDMKTRLLGFVREIEQMKGPEKALLESHIPHFREIVNFIDWKLEILTKVCPFDWTGYAGDVERTASVQMQEGQPEKEPIAGGYLGG
jgi:hypothetical protein